MMDNSLKFKKFAMILRKLDNVTNTLPKSQRPIPKLKYSFNPQDEFSNPAQHISQVGFMRSTGNLKAALLFTIPISFFTIQIFTGSFKCLRK
jgi:hypothetical protein